MSENSCTCKKLADILSLEPPVTGISGPLDAGRGIQIEIFVTGDSPSVDDILRIHEYVDLMALAYAANPKALTVEQRQFLESLEALAAEPTTEHQTAEGAANPQPEEPADAK